MAAQGSRTFTWRRADRCTLTARMSGPCRALPPTERSPGILCPEPDRLVRRFGDYECLGGSGNGPNYIAGPVSVVGYDEFRLDADHDGIGCE